MVNIGRNDPCPCGSGKKYKKCCLNKPGGPGIDMPFSVMDDPRIRQGIEQGQTFMETMGQPNLATESLNDLKQSLQWKVDLKPAAD